jgi:2-enoate reductase
LGRIFAGRPLSCAVNPSVGREIRYAIKRADEQKRVIIAGGGVAGLEAARTAALRGHLVTLYEKTDLLGGHLISGSIPMFKKDLRSLLSWYESEVFDLGVEIRTGYELTPEVIEREKADALIIASGSRPILPSLPGIEKEVVATAPEVLLGTKRPGDRIVVAGGGLVGCETAIWLSQMGKRVTVVEMLKDLMTGSNWVPHVIKHMVLDMLEFNRVAVMTSTRLVGVIDDGVNLLDASAGEKSLDADTVVVSVGLKPERALYRSLAGKTPNLYLIGDAREARNIMGAVWDAYEVARAI